jgi:hypothetical protein
MSNLPERQDRDARMHAIDPPPRTSNPRLSSRSRSRPIGLGPQSTATLPLPPLDPVVTTHCTQMLAQPLYTRIGEAQHRAQRN